MHRLRNTTHRRNLHSNTGLSVQSSVHRRRLYQDAPDKRHCRALIRHSRAQFNPREIERPESGRKSMSIALAGTRKNGTRNLPSLNSSRPVAALSSFPRQQQRVQIARGREKGRWIKEMRYPGSGWVCPRRCGRLAA